MNAPTTQEAEPTERQREVLDAVLALLVEGGDAITMSAVARRASCSKETLYKWFGDRDGLLTATVRWQASKVRAGSYDRQHLDASTLAESLESFAVNWLSVISSTTSIALNRVAIGTAAAGKSDLGRIVLANGRFAIGERLKPLLEDARTAGLIDFDDTEAAFRTFFGLVGRDVQIRLLLGDDLKLSSDQIARDAALATRQFLKLFGKTNSASFEARPSGFAPQDEGGRREARKGGRREVLKDGGGKREAPEIEEGRRKALKFEGGGRKPPLS